MRAAGESILDRAPVIPAKAGIQNRPAKIATRNQARIASDKSPLP